MSKTGPTMNLDVVLRPWPATEERATAPPALYKQIEQLTNERGYLRSITEKSLQDDINAGNHVTAGVTKGTEQTDTKYTSTKQEKIQELPEKNFQMAQKLE